jgi:predicted DNA-binding transcriptional regulator AlpA
MDRLLSKKVVCEITGRPYISLYKTSNVDLFPRPIKQGEGHFARIYWWESEIEAWQQSLQRQSYLGDPDRVETPLDQIRREAGRKDSLAFGQLLQACYSRQLSPKQIEACNPRRDLDDLERLYRMAERRAERSWHSLGPCG